MPTNGNSWRTSPMYTLSEAARLVNTTSGTVRRWLQGYATTTDPKAPVFGEKNDSQLVSFLQLIEIVVANQFRTRKISLERVRSAYLRARQKYSIEYPFAHMRLESIGGHIVYMLHHDDDSSLEVADTAGMYTLPGMVQETIAKKLEYEDELAARWYPRGKEVPIVIDPRYAAGLPTIQHRGVTIEHIKGRFDAGQTIGFICRDLTLSRNQVEEAIRYADKIAA